MRDHRRSGKYAAIGAKTLALLAAIYFSEDARAVDFSTVNTTAGNPVIVCRVDLKTERLQMFLRDERGQALKTFDAVNALLRPTGRKLTFAMNAGLYHADHSPVGLCVAEGRELTPLVLKSGEGNFFLKPNGIFILTASGARIVESSRWSAQTERAILATQSGPLLVSGGKIHPAFNPGSESRLFRNGVGVPSPGVALFAITKEPVNFHEFATFFRDVLRCPDALFLDGTISSLFSEQLKRNDQRMDLGPIIGVTVPIE
jgi:uncharacterized protein YigE (DUF2233 family)